MRNAIRTHVRTILWIAVAALLFPALAAGSADENKATVLKYFEALNAGKADGYEVFFTQNPVGHDQRGQLSETPGAAGASRIVSDWKERYSSYKLTAEDTTASGDKVAVRFSWSGHNQQYDKDVSIVGVLFFRMEEGKIAESWAAWDELSVVQGLGFTVTPPEAEEGEEKEGE